jgi:Flp pilus assembly protein protease CpaA
MATLPDMTFELLALTVCIIWAVTLATLDLITFRIYNLSLLMGVFLVWPALFLIGTSFNLSLAVLAFTLVVSAAGLTSLIGMGDVKLLLLAAPWLHFENMRNPLILLIVLSWMQLMAVLVLKRCFPQRIAFAPAILAALALNMAT